MSLRVDLQCHSRFSDRPHEWILRRIGAPQSYTTPDEVYQRLHAAGMDLKTITDHNRIDGCLEIADRPDVFLSEEVTTYFPDGCKIHLLVWNLTESNHREIEKLRANIFELSAYLRDQQIPHGVTHALVSINQQLTPDHFEKLILLFQIFEARNGNREPLAQEIANLCLESLTPEKIDELANRHNLTPTHAHAHHKILTGGSDDHGGLYLGKTFTEAPLATSREAFFAALTKGEVRAAGLTGTPLQLSSNLYTTSFQFLAEKLKTSAPLASRLLQNVAQRFLAGKNPTAFSFGERVSLVVEGIRTGQAFEFVKPGESTLAVEFSNFFNDPKLQERLEEIIQTEPNAERRSFRMSAHITNQLTYRLLLEFQKRVQRGSLLDAMQAATGLLPVASALLPYFVAFRQHEANRPLLESASARFLPEKPDALRNEKRAWFTDTLEDVNGVARTIRAMTLAARAGGHDLTVVTSRSSLSITDIPIRNFAPVGEFEIPEYELQKLSFPPVLEMVDYIQREGFTELIISTPGPVGLAALAAGKLLGLRLSSIYHTDFPQYARFLGDDAFMESLVWSYMEWFYGQFHLVYVNSEFYRKRWMERGFREERLKILPRGLDTDLFDARHRDESFWKKRGTHGPVLLYVGRISKEKDLSLLPDVMARLKKIGVDATLALVGEGPYRAELQQLLPEAVFTGVLTGRELGMAYASADLFVFPSTTDTFGNVVIEALASGLPVAVSDVGGPRELVKKSEQGRVLPARDAEAWAQALAEMLTRLPSREERQALSQAVHDQRSWNHAAEVFWSDGLI